MLVAGWLVGLPAPLLIMWAPTWGWIVAANVLLGVNQGLAWSTTVIMKIDLAGPDRRGLAMGLNEAAGYGAVAVTALVTGWITTSAGLRPEPFFLGLAYAGLGLGLSVLAVRETRDHARHEAATHDPPGGSARWAVCGCGVRAELVAAAESAYDSDSRVEVVLIGSDSLATSRGPTRTSSVRPRRWTSCAPSDTDRVGTRVRPFVSMCRQMSG